MKTNRSIVKKTEQAAHDLLVTVTQNVSTEPEGKDAEAPSLNYPG